MAALVNQWGCQALVFVRLDIQETTVKQKVTF